MRANANPKRKKNKLLTVDRKKLGKDCKAFDKKHKVPKVKWNTPIK